MNVDRRLAVVPVASLILGSVIGGISIARTPPAEPAIPGDPEQARLFAILDTAPITIWPSKGHPYDPLTIARIVNALQPLGKARAVSVLTSYIRPTDRHPLPSTPEYDAWEAHQRIGLVYAMRVLFEVPEDPGYMPSMGVVWDAAPRYPKKPPRYPVLIVGDLPLLADGDYDRFGVADLLAQHLAYYASHCAIRAHPLKPTDRPLDVLPRLNGVDDASRDDIWDELTLVEKELYPDQKDQHFTLHQRLIMAVKAGNVDNVKSLLDRGASPNTRSAFGDTALYEACSGRRGGLDKRTEICRELLDHGADKRAVTNRGETAIMAATMSGNVPALRLLLERGISPQAVDQDGTTAVIAAARFGQIGCLRVLLEARASLHMATKHGETPLLAASSSGRVEMVDFLVQHGASLRDRDNDGQSALTNAVRWPCNPALVRYLLDHGADPDARSDGGENALSIALDTGVFRPEPAALVKLLLEHGANATARSATGATMLATVMGRQRDLRDAVVIATLLLDHGAVMFGAGIDGDTIMALAVRWAIERADAMPILRRTLEDPTDVNARLLNDDTVLIRAVRAALDRRVGSPERRRLNEIVEMLLKKNASPDVMRREDGRTPLIDAAYRGDALMIGLLLEYHADPLVREGGSRQTALEIARAFHRDEAARALATATNRARELRKARGM